MHVYSITLSLAVVCASAFAADGVPEYANARRMADRAIDKVQQLIYTKAADEDSLPGPKRNYAIFVAVLDALADKLSKGLGPIYDNVYFNTVDEVVPEAWTNPDKVRQNFARQVDTFTDVTMPLRMLIEKHCDNMETVQCNKAVDLEVQTYPEKYGNSKALLLTAAELAKLFLDNTHENYAKNNQIITYILTNGKHELRDIVDKYVALKSIKL